MKRTLRAGLGVTLALLLSLPASAQSQAPHFPKANVDLLMKTDGRMIVTPDQRNPPRRVKQPTGRTRAIVAAAFAGAMGAVVAIFCAHGTCWERVAHG